MEFHRKFGDDLDYLERSESSFGEFLRWASCLDVLRRKGDHVADFVVGFSITMSICISLIVFVCLEDFSLAVSMEFLNFSGFDRRSFVGNFRYLDVERGVESFVGEERRYSGG